LEGSIPSPRRSRFSLHTITLDRYGHLFPGSEVEALGLLNAYLDR
jgi:hypothetical protein